MLGVFQSDPLEKRFSWYRQLSGGLYYLSPRQIFEHEKKIRVHSLLIYSGRTVEDLAEIGSKSKEGELDKITKSAEDLASELAEILLDFDEMDDADAQVICYVSGAFARSEWNQKKCVDCFELLVEKEDTEEKLPILTLDGVITEDARQFLNEISRGGLLVPSNRTFTVGLKCWNVFSVIQKSGDLKNKFMDSTVSNKKLLFAEIIRILITEDMVMSDESVGEYTITDTCCPKGHNFVSSLACRFFNCMCKNLVKQLTARNVDAAAKTKLKVAKLSSSQLH